VGSTKKSTGRKLNKKMHLQDPDGVGGSGSLPPASDDDNAVSGTMGIINNSDPNVFKVLLNVGGGGEGE
jgi:hypothetical protein